MPTATTVPPPRMDRTASANVSAPPTASKAKSKPPCEICRLEGRRCAETQRLLPAARQRIDGDDSRRARDPRPLDAELADAACPDDQDAGAGLDLCPVQHRSDPGQRRAAEQRRVLERNVYG